MNIAKNTSGGFSRHDSTRECHNKGLMISSILTFLISLHFVGLSNADAQSCGQGTFNVQVGGVDVTPFQEVCPNTTITFTLSGTPPNSPEWSIVPLEAGSFANGNQSGSSVTVTWHSSGKLKVDYYDGTASQCEEINYTITGFDAGTVNGPNAVCVGESFSLTLSNSQNAGTAIWQQCTTGCTVDANWTSLGAVTGSPLQINNLTVTTRYRTKLEYSLCGGGIDYSPEKIVSATPFAATTLSINDPGPICTNSASEIVFNVIEETGVAPNATYEWFRNGTNNGEVGGPGDTNTDPKIYDPYDPTYTFQTGETIYVKVSAANYCDFSSAPVTITFANEQFPTLGSITSGPVCEGRQVTFQCEGRSGNWQVGSGGFPYTGSNYTVNVDDINGEVVRFTTSVVGSCGSSLPLSTNTSAISALPVPQSFASNDELCNGETTSIIISSSIIGATYQWTAAHQNVAGPTSPGTSSTISQTLTLTTSAAGKVTYTITSTAPSGCVSDPILVDAIVNPLPVNPILPPVQFCDFQPVTLKGDAPEGISYFRWYDMQGNFLSQAHEYEVDVFPAGSYSYQYAAVSDHGCVSGTLAALNINVTAQCNDELNWIESINYAPLNGSPSQTVSHSKTYFDFSGKAIQSQSRNFTENEVLSSGSVEDQYGRIVINSLIAPTGETQFFYKHWLIKDHNNRLYDHTTLGNPFGTSPGTVGWYYSGSNTKEQHVPQSQHPYTRIEYYEDGSGEVKKSAGPGEVHRLGMGHEVLSGTFPVYNELDDYLQRRRNALQLTDNLDIASLVKRGVQSVVRDQNGNIAVSISDQSGNTVMSARKGTAQDQIISIPISITSTVDPQDENYRPITYFYLLNDETVAISAGNNYVVEDIVAGTTYSIPANSVWAQGFYRIILSSGSVTLSYTNHFLDVSYQFYDDAGRLKSSLSPNGFKQLKDNSSLSYAQVDQTSYVYNHQGWLLSMTEPDAGTTNYKYRKDGKIRFSQNAEQAKPEKNDFSYTHYDALGRPTESGEYMGIQYTFATVSSQLEYGQQVVFLSADIRDWVRTHYDRAYFDAVGVNIPNLPTDNNKLTQEFTRGAVSWTENTNIQTWYSYDELGRVVWMAQKPKVLNRTFVTRYTYDFLGNVLTVKNSAYVNGNELEIFFHHYVYDADQRLSQAFTSTDGTNKKLRATYEYYLHGPLKRIELGDKLQGIDFVYNINGWLTQINHPSKDKIKDPGQDGGTLHPDVLPDVFGMVLDYYDSDMAGLYAAGSGPTIQNLHQIHGLPSNDHRYANHQPLIRFEQITDPSSVTPTNVMKQYSAENPRYRKLLLSD